MSAGRISLQRRKMRSQDQTGASGAQGLRQSGGSEAPSFLRSSVQGERQHSDRRCASDKFFCGSEFTMAPRAYWKGFLRLSLVSCPIALFPATSEREKIRFHQINRKTGDRIRYVKVDAETGKEVDNEGIIKGYEKKKGEYIPVEPDELEAVAIESKHTIEIDEFVPREEIDQLYLANPYYIVPDGDAGTQAFAVIRDGIEKKGMVGIGRIVFTTREHTIALEARGKGILGVTLRYPYEVRDERKYFDDIPSERVTKDMLDLAAHIIKTKSGHSIRKNLRITTSRR